MSSFENWIRHTPIANRGLYNDEIPENSLEAIKRAIDKNYGVCLDVRALADNSIVVFCDATLGRMTKTDGFVRHLTLSDVNELYLDGSNQKIPTLTEALELIDGKVPVIINIKSLDTTRYEKYVWKTIQDYKGEYAIASANPFTLEWFKIHAPKVKRGQISSFYKGSSLPLKTRSDYKRMKLNATVSEPNFIMYKASDLPNRFVKKYKDLPILAYHVNNQSLLEKCRKCADNIVFENVEL